MIVTKPFQPTEVVCDCCGFSAYVEDGESASERLKGWIKLCPPVEDICPRCNPFTRKCDQRGPDPRRRAQTDQTHD